MGCGEMGRWGDGEMGCGEMGRWGDGGVREISAHSHAPAWERIPGRSGVPSSAPPSPPRRFPFFRHDALSRAASHDEVPCDWTPERPSGVPTPERGNEKDPGCSCSSASQNHSAPRPHLVPTLRRGNAYPDAPASRRAHCPPRPVASHSSAMMRFQNSTFPNLYGIATYSHADFRFDQSTIPFGGSKNPKGPGTHSRR